MRIAFAYMVRCTLLCIGFIMQPGMAIAEGSWLSLESPSGYTCPTGITRFFDGTYHVVSTSMQGGFVYDGNTWTAIDGWPITPRSDSILRITPHYISGYMTTSVWPDPAAWIIDRRSGQSFPYLQFATPWTRLHGFDEWASEAMGVGVVASTPSFGFVGGERWLVPGIRYVVPYGLDFDQRNGAFRVVGRYLPTSGGWHGFLAHGTYFVLPELDFPGATVTYPMGIDGPWVVGYYTVDGRDHGFLYNITMGTWSTLDFPGALNTRAMDVSFGYYPDEETDDPKAPYAVVGYYDGWKGFLYCVNSYNKPIDFNITITEVRMVSDHELEVSTKRSFGVQRGSVRLELTVNGTSIVTDPVALASNDSQAEDGEPIVVDLEQYSVPRFTANQRFKITATAQIGNGGQVSDTKDVVILLPVVIVPGINSGVGGDGTFDDLEEHFRVRSDVGLRGIPALGEGYRLRQDATGYPTLYTLSYATNTDTLAPAADKLEALINEVRSKTYADSFVIIGHSKGGLVGRKYCQAKAGLHVARLITAQTPHMGSLWAKLNVIGDGWRCLYPVYKSNRRVSAQPFMYDPPYASPEIGNSELSRLNGMAVLGWDNDRPFPGGVPLVLLYSDHSITPYTRTGLLSPATCSGDGIVPAFSQLGRNIDPNDSAHNPNNPFIARLIPALAAANLSTACIPGGHVGYLEQPDVMQFLFAQCYSQY